MEHRSVTFVSRKNSPSRRGYPLNIKFGPVEVRCTGICNKDRIWKWVVPPKSGDGPPSRRDGTMQDSRAAKG